MFLQKQHREELKHRRVLDAEEQALADTEVQKCPHPLEDHCPHLFNPVSGEIAPDDVNVADLIVICDRMGRKYIAGLPGGFYEPISSPIKTMEVVKKKNVSNKTRPVIDLENIFLRLLMIGQQRQMELRPLFSHELCAVPPSLTDEHGCLYKGSKSGVVKHLGVPEVSPAGADIVIVDVSQLFYQSVCPYGSSITDLVASIQGRLS